VGFVARGLQRFYGGHDLHFITCSRYHCQPELGTAYGRDPFPDDPTFANNPNVRAPGQE
jgi:hypothetical protein